MNARVIRNARGYNAELRAMAARAKSSIEIEKVMNQQHRWALLFLSFITLLAVGCPPNAAPSEDGPPAAVWVEEGLEHGGAKIALGYRKTSSGSAGALVPIAAITRNGQPVAGAMVFTRYVHLSRGGNETIADEVATVFEEARAGETPVYVPSTPLRPTKKAPTAVRYRIALPHAEEDWRHDMKLP